MKASAGSRWQLLLEQRPVPLSQAIVEEVAKTLSADLSRWPLPIQELDPEAGRAFIALLSTDALPPSRAALEQSIQLAKWELEREFDAYDDYMRNKRWLEAGLTASDKSVLLFVSRWLVEQLLALSESTDGRVGRQMLIQCLASTRRRLFAPT
jgi:hypothetical protein